MFTQTKIKDKNNNNNKTKMSQKNDAIFFNQHWLSNDQLIDGWWQWQSEFSLKQFAISIKAFSIRLILMHKMKNEYKPYKLKASI